MGTVSSTTSTTNPYVIAYSTSDIIGSDPVATAAAKSSSTSSNSTSSSSGSYSQSLISQMSGIDVNSLVNEMMTSDYLKLNTLLSKQQVTQWTQDRYRSVITNLNNFSDNYFDILSSNNVTSASGYSIYNPISTSPSAVTASVSNQATAGTYTINSASLATASKIVGTTSFSSLASTSTATDLINAIGGSFDGKISFDFTTNGGTTKTVSYDLTSDANKNKTITQVMNDLSSQTGTTFSYSELTGKFSITDNTTGTGNYITIDTSNTDSTVQSNTQSFFNKIVGNGTPFDNTNTTRYIGKKSDPNDIATTDGNDGTFTITEPDGSSNTVTKSSNNFTIDGVTYNFTSNISSPVNINVTTDVSSVVSKIQNFINDYNNLIGGIQDAINEKKDYNYQPLTAQQEAQMTSDQITKWNQQAQQGLLANDGTLNNMLTSMRQAFYTPVSGSNLTLSDIGLSTSDYVTQGGKITVDVSKLTSALQNDPQGVINILTQTSTSVPTYSTTLNGSQLSTRNSEEGIFQRLHDIKQEYSNDVITDGILVDKAGNSTSDISSTLYKEIKDESDVVTQFKTKITNDQKMYTAKFTSLQSALSQLSTQQSYLSSMLSSYSSG